MRVYRTAGVTETPIQPHIVMLGTDPRNIYVGVVWQLDGWCVGELQAHATETSGEVRIDPVIDQQYSHGGACAGVGTAYNTAWAENLTLNAPVGNRSVVRSSDSVQLPVLAHGDRFIRKHPVSADIQQYGGVNDNPALALKKTVHITNPNALENLATLLDSSPPYPSRTGPCPNDDGSYYVVDLNYAVGGGTSLRINATGCQAVYEDESKKPIAWVLHGPPGIFTLLIALLAV